MIKLEKNFWGKVLEVDIEYDNDKIEDESEYDDMKIQAFNKFSSKICKQLDFISENRDEIVKFLEDDATFPCLDNINQQVNKKGQFLLIGGVSIVENITQKEIEDSYVLDSINVEIFSDDTFTVIFDIISENPDYFGGNSICLSIEEDNELMFEGING